MALLPLKLILTPLLIGGASIAARRWGPAVGGWLVALPLTSGPVALYLALEHGTSFAAGTAEGSLAGLAATAVFGLAYARVAQLAPAPRGWPRAWLAAAVAFVALAAVSARLATLPVWALAAAIEVWLAATYTALPAGRTGGSAPAPRPGWELPARVLVGTSLVLGITAVAATVGPAATGIASTFPVYVSVLAVFAHHAEGAAPAIAVVRGTATGLFGTAAFMAVLSVAIVPVGTAVAFVAALMALAVAQAAVLLLLRRRRARSASAADAALNA